ncbi:cyclophilin-like protein [Neocallimastix sp. 'constans']
MSVIFDTDLGEIKIEIFCEAVPKTAENFLALCASGYYDNCIFHSINLKFLNYILINEIIRNIKGFMIQTGDPTGTGKGGTSIWGKPFEDEIKPTLKHNRRGIVSMANNGPNTNKSQFFITYSKQSHLDTKYTVFGKVIDGMETLDALEKVSVDEKYRPIQEVKIKSVTILANPIADKE